VGREGDTTCETPERIAKILPKQLQARELPLKRTDDMTNPTQINQGGAQNQERQPPEQTGQKAKNDKAIEKEARKVSR